MKNFAEIHFSNTAFADIFRRYANNSVISQFIGDDGSADITLDVPSAVEPPKNCEQVLSLMFSLFESNPEAAISQVYLENQKEILRDIVFDLSEVIDGFSEIKLILSITDENGTNTRTEFKLSKVSTSQTENNN